MADKCLNCKYGDFPPPDAIMGLPTGAGYCKLYGPRSYMDPACSSFERKEGCYIATAVYGSYDTPQVLMLRLFRDEILANSRIGRLFIRLYYRFSPFVAKHLKTASLFNRGVRHMLDKLVSVISNRYL